MVLNKQRLIEMVIDLIDLLIKQSPSLESMLFALLDKGEVALFGGVVRDIAILGKPVNLRDIDIVVSVPSNEVLLPIFRSLNYRRTRFGGFHCFIDGLSLDIWALGETWAFREKLLEPAIENLPRSVFLTINAVVITLGNRKMHEYKFFESINKRTIDIVLEKNPFPALCVLRALVLRRKYDFVFSDALRDYIRHFWNCSNNPLEEINHMQLSHYGNRVISDKDILHDIKKYVF